MSLAKAEKSRFKFPLIFLAVTGSDRPGIIASVTEFLYRLGANLEDVSMTLLDQKFSMMLVFQLAKKNHLKIEKGLKLLEKKMGLSFFWKEYGSRSKKTAILSSQDSEYYLVRAIGPDQTGIVFHLSRIMARAGLNITDLQTKVIGKAEKPLYALLMETPVPIHLSAKVESLRKQLALLGRQLKIEIQLTRVESIAF